VRLNCYGKIANQVWLSTSDHYKQVGLSEFVVMPNHIHGIIVISNSGHVVGAGHCPVPTKTTSHPYGQLSKVINSFKGVVTKRIRFKHPRIDFAWQRSFHDHIIRNEGDYQRIVKYIKFNPQTWLYDRNNRYAQTH
jgi:REP element-mobilizing transposase RayT